MANRQTPLEAAREFTHGGDPGYRTCAINPCWHCARLVALLERTAQEAVAAARPEIERKAKMEALRQMADNVWPVIQKAETPNEIYERMLAAGVEENTCRVEGEQQARLEIRRTIDAKIARLEGEEGND